MTVSVSVVSETSRGFHQQKNDRVMLKLTPPILFILVNSVAIFGQTKSYVSAHKGIRAWVVPVGPESRLDIRSASGMLLRRKDLTSRDQSHGEHVDHVEWTADGRFLVFTTSSSGGHQPWHVATYFYSVGRNQFYSVDAIVGAIISDFALRGDVLSTTRLGVNLDDPKPVTLSLRRWR
jgi:hypothetical protein